MDLARRVKEVFPDSDQEWEAKGHNFQHASADHPLFLALAEIAAARNVAIDLHMEAIAASTPTPGGLRRACGANPESLPPSVPPLERLLAAQRGARIVWQHIGWDNVGAMTPALLQGLLERHPNLFLGLRVEARTTRMGGDGPMPNRLVDAQLKLLPEWQAFPLVPMRRETPARSKLL